MKIRIYTTDCCPKCRALKIYLKDLGIEVETRDMSKYMMYLDARNAWPKDCAAPVMEVFKGEQQTFYDHYDLFDRNGLKKSSIDFIVEAV